MQIEKNNTAYQKKAKQLVNKFFKETEKNADNFPLDFVDWMISRKENWLSNSWRLYKGSALDFLNNIQESKTNFDNLSNAIKKLESELSNTGKTKCKSRVKGSRKLTGTSRDKFKSVPDKKKELIFDELNRAYKKYPDGYAKLTRLWLEAGILLGLRPGEWKLAKIKGNTSDFFYGEDEDDILRLIVKNAKYSKGSNRSNGEDRTLILINMDKEDIITVLDFFSLLNEFLEEKGNFKRVNKSVARCLYSANLKVLPASSKHIALYSARHQFVSNLKADGYPPVITAALLGHASIKTAQTTYGRKTSGKSGFRKVMPSSADVERIIDNTPKHIINKIKESSNNYPSM